MRGYWWAPDGASLLVARVDENPVQRWYIADPANPERPPAAVAYPAAGTPNADVSLLLAGLDGSRVEVDIGGAAFPYLVTVASKAGGDPLIVVQSRDQRVMRLLAADPATGATTVLREDTDPRWVDIVPGVPARTGDGRMVWTADSDGARRLLVGTPDELAGAPPPRSPRPPCRSAGSSAWTATWCCSPRRGPIRPRSGCGCTALAGGDRWHEASARAGGGTEARRGSAGCRRSARRGRARGTRAAGTTVMISRTMTEPGPRSGCSPDSPGRALPPRRPRSRCWPSHRTSRPRTRTSSRRDPGDPQRAAASFLARARLGLLPYCWTRTAARTPAGARRRRARSSRRSGSPIRVSRCWSPTAGVRPGAARSGIGRFGRPRRPGA